VTRAWTVLMTVLVTLAAFAGTAFAADAVTSEDGSLIDLAKPVLDAVVGGNYALAAVLAVVFFVALASKYGKSAWPFLGTGAGKAVLTLVGAFVGAVATAVAAGGFAAVTAGVLWTALGVAVSAAGGYALAKELLGPLVPRLPAWAQPLARLVLALFDRKGAATKATEAGATAVADKPSTGIAGVLGAPRDVE
jgi:hypothetical protein